MQIALNVTDLSNISEFTQMEILPMASKDCKMAGIEIKVLQYYSSSDNRVEKDIP